jgi:hypothetical protein
LILSGCSSIPLFDLQSSADWNSDDTTREVSFQVVNILDALQTNEIRSRPDVVEVGPVARAMMGPEPSGSDVALYFATRALSHYLISRILPPRWREWYQTTSLVSASFVVWRNCEKYELLCN